MEAPRTLITLMDAISKRNHPIATTTIGGLAIMLAVASSISGNWLATLLAVAIIPPLIAINWRRADNGRDGTAKQNAANKIHNREAFNDLSVLLGSELVHVEEEIDRTSDMIRHAVSGLLDNFQQLHDLSAQLARVIHENLGEDANNGNQTDMQTRIKNVLNTLEKNQPKREEAVTAAIRSLQFEDMSSQALNEALRSLDYLRELTGILQQVSDAEELAEKIHQHHATSACTRRKPVSQKNLDEGLAELF
jgi:Arc/MetJ-type ribon-helix-helix transcriptional regulator